MFGIGKKNKAPLPADLVNVGPNETSAEVPSAVQERIALVNDMGVLATGDSQKAQDIARSNVVDIPVGDESPTPVDVDVEVHTKAA